MILNLTQHKATQDQIDQGVVDFDDETRAKISQLLTFDEMPDRNEMIERAYKLVTILRLKNHNECKVMIGGAPFFMPILEHALYMNEFNPVFAFSKRVSVEKEVDGKIIKTNEFKHIGFIRSGI